MRGISICLIFIIIAICQTFCRPETKTRNCKAYRRPALHDVLNRICIVCHEIFSVSQPDLHAECHSNCFRNPKFDFCLNFFRPKISTFIG